MLGVERISAPKGRKAMHAQSIQKPQLPALVGIASGKIGPAFTFPVINIDYIPNVPNWRKVRWILGARDAERYANDASYREMVDEHAHTARAYVVEIGCLKPCHPYFHALATVTGDTDGADTLKAQYDEVQRRKAQRYALDCLESLGCSRGFIPAK